MTRRQIEKAGANLVVEAKRFAVEPVRFGGRASPCQPSGHGEIEEQRQIWCHGVARQAIESFEQRNI